jgi:uncharacterized protein (UPF0332 family)
MNKEAAEFWSRAIKTLQSARLLSQTDPDSCASRSYYAAFYAVSALFAIRGQTYSKHSAVESAVHRDLVRPGHWPKELGAAYSSLLALRATGDYGGLEHVSESEAEEAIQAVQRILQAVYEAHSDVFSDPTEIL